METQEGGWFTARYCKLHIGNGSLNKYPGCFQVFPGYLLFLHPRYTSTWLAHLALPGFPNTPKDVSSVCLTRTICTCQFLQTVEDYLFGALSSLIFVPIFIRISLVLFFHFTRPLTFKFAIQKKFSDTFSSILISSPSSAVPAIRYIRH